MLEIAANRYTQIRNATSTPGELLLALYDGLFRFVNGAKVVGVIAGEFVLSGAGMGHAIAFAYNSFDNRMMYGLIVLLFVVVGGINTALWTWERRLYARRAGR